MPEKCFEDEFMELQTEWLELAAEATGNTVVDKICVYVSMEKGHFYMPDVFFIIGNKAVNKEEVITPPRFLSAYLRQYANSVMKMDELCETYKRPCPTEFKLIYDMNRETLEAKYQYEPVVDWNPRSDKNLHAPFEEWFAEMQQSLDSETK